jgi:ribose transport system ATP-binding protein
VSPQPLLEFDSISKSYGPVQALREVSLACHAGRVHGLLGENGAGKSTLLGILAGATVQDAGRVRVGHEQIEPAIHSPRHARAIGVAVVQQELALVPSMTVTENIFLGREVQGGAALDRAEMRQAAREALGRLNADIDVDLPVEELSIAQGQLVEIARALAMETRVLALDEPSAVLAGDELDALFEVVRALRAQGVAVIYVSHRLDEVFALCDDYTVLKDGRVSGTGVVAETDTDSIIRLMVGRDVERALDQASGEPGELLLRAEGVTVEGLISDISLEARAGEIVGLAGLIGSGRTTLGKALFGALRITRGDVEVCGRRGPFSSPARALAAGLAYLPEDRKAEGLALDKSVRANLTMLCPAELRSGWRLISRRREADVVRRMIERLAIRTDPDGAQLVGRLSGGNQQKVVLGKWLLADPRVLILDEPTRGIDVGAKAQIYRLLRELADEGRAVIVISSELIEIVGLCDRVLVLSEGRLAGELHGEAATEEGIMRLATPASSAVEAA